LVKTRNLGKNVNFCQKRKLLSKKVNFCQKRKFLVKKGQIYRGIPNFYYKNLVMTILKNYFIDVDEWRKCEDTQSMPMARRLLKDEVILDILFINYLTI